MGRGRLPAIAAILAAAALAPAARAATFTVTTTADAGAGSLRQAIANANATPGADTITFSIPGSGLRTITLTSGALPALTEPAVIDATTIPGYAGVPLVRLDNGTGGAIAGLDLGAGSSQVRGLRITR